MAEFTPFPNFSLLLEESIMEFHSKFGSPPGGLMIVLTDSNNNELHAWEFTGDTLGRNRMHLALAGAVLTHEATHADV